MKVKASLDYYFRVCDEGRTGDCGGVEYNVVLAIADFDGDGIFQADEVFNIFLKTCDPSEVGFVAEVEVTDGHFEVTDLSDEPIILEEFNLAANGKTKDRGTGVYRLRSRGCGWTADSAATDLNPDITGRKCRFNANPIAIEELPFTAEDLVAEGVISDVSDLNCASTLFADAGDDQTADTGKPVTLDGSGSNPAGGTFAWVLTVPEGSTTAALSDPAIVNPTFTPDVDGTYTVELTYTVGEESDTDTVEVVAVTNPVTANAGDDETVQAGEDVLLEGGASTPEGGTFAWFLSNRPIGSEANIAEADSQTALLSTDLEGTYTVELTYTVGEEIDTDTMVVTAGTKVTADAGPDEIVNVGDLVTLDGSGSTPDGGIFLWFLDRPLGSDAQLTGRDTATPTFTPDVEGSYIGILFYTVGEVVEQDNVEIDAEDPGI